MNFNPEKNREARVFEYVAACLFVLTTAVYTFHNWYFYDALSMTLFVASVWAIIICLSFVE